MPELAVTLPIPGVSLADTAAFVERCRPWGYTAAWASEVAGPDFASLCGAVAQGSDVALGVAVAPVFTRSPWLLAATASTLSQLSGGRFTLGLGTSSEVIVEQWSGVPFSRPLSHLRETVEVVRAMLAGERVDHDGLVTTHGYRLFAPPPEPVSIVVGALNPKSLAQAGEIGDGVCLNQLSPAHVRQALNETGRAGDADFAVVARLFCVATDDIATARTFLRSMFAPYIATTVYNRFYRWLGFTEEADAVLTAFQRKDREAAAAAVSDALLDAAAVVGSDEEVGARVAEYVQAGVTVPVIAPVAASAADAERTLRAAATAL